MNINFKKDHVKIEIDLTIYDIETLHKCFYWYGNEYSVDIHKNNDDNCNIKLFPKNYDTINKENHDLIKNKIRNDLIDFKVRSIVSKETKQIRELIIAKAFSHFED